jgi:hypothetical protein
MAKNSSSGSKIYQRRIPALSLVVNVGASKVDFRDY